MDKVTKKDADYGHGMGETRCKNCQHFIAPRSCRKVQGEVDREAWCKLFRWRRARVERPA